MTSKTGEAKYLCKQSMGALGSEVKQSENVLQVGFKHHSVLLMQIYAKLSACKWADESTLDANIHMQLTLSFSFGILARWQCDTRWLAPNNERLILDF